MQYKRILARFLIFGMLGLLLEVLGGAMRDLMQFDWDLRGDTSPWMILDYGLFGVILMPVARPLIRRGVPLVFRALVYMTVIFTVEYVSGVIFHFILGIHVWDYSGMPYNLHGQIVLSCVFPWYFLGLIGEYLYRRVDACAVVLTQGLKAEQLEQADFGAPAPTVECETS